MNDLLAAVSSGELVSTLRVALFAAGLLAAALWNRARPRASLLVLSLSSGAGLSYWLIQISPPFGLGVDLELTRQWAQAGVNAALGRSDLGYVWGTAGMSSLAPMMAALGMPLGLVFRLPQIGALLLLAMLAGLPLLTMRNRTTAAFAGGLALAGLWPGQTVFDAALGRPAFVALTLGCGILLAALSRVAAARAALRHRSFPVAVALIGLGALLTAVSREGWVAAFGALLFAVASMVLAPWLRFAVRRLAPSPPRARGVEAFLLLAAFSGGGLFWWNPPQTVRGFIPSRDEGGAILKPLAWIRANVGPDDVVLASRAYGDIVAARTGHRVLILSRPGETEDVVAQEPARRARFNQSVLEGRPLARLAEHYTVTHLLLGPGEAAPSGSFLPAPPDEETLTLSAVYQDAEDFRVFRFTKK